MGCFFLPSINLYKITSVGRCCMYICIIKKVLKNFVEEKICIVFGKEKKTRLKMEEYRGEMVSGLGFFRQLNGRLGGESRLPFWIGRMVRDFCRIFKHSLSRQSSVMSVISSSSLSYGRQGPSNNNKSNISLPCGSKRVDADYTCHCF